MKGATLVELLTVVAITALVLSLALPAIARAYASSKRTLTHCGERYNYRLEIASDCSEDTLRFVCTTPDWLFARKEYTVLFTNSLVVGSND